MATNYAARENSSYKVICSVPDVCLTPAGAAKVPIPYPIVATLAPSNNASKNVFIESDAAFIYDSDTVSTTGAAPGVDKGIKSGTVNEKAEPQEKSSTFFINKQNVIRVNDMFYMNNRNTQGFLVQNVPIPEGRITDEGIAPPPPEEELGFFASAWQSIKDAGDAVLVEAVKLDEEYKIVNRLDGLATAVVGGLEMAGGTALILTPEPTTLTKIGGAAAIGIGVDNVSTGIQQIWSGEKVSTVMEQATDYASTKVSEISGVSAETTATAAHAIAIFARPSKIGSEAAGYGQNMAQEYVEETLGVTLANGKKKRKKKGTDNNNNKGGKDGAESKGKEKCREKGESKRKGQCGESLVDNQMKKQGFETFDTGKLTNNQGNGFDNIGVNNEGDVRAVVIETKANQSQLNKAQKLGGEIRTDNLIKEMKKAVREKGAGRYKHMMEYADETGLIPKSRYSSPEEFESQLDELEDLIKETEGNRYYCVCRVKLQDDKTRCYRQNQGKKKGICKAKSIKCKPWPNKTTTPNDKDKTVCKKFNQR